MRQIDYIHEYDGTLYQGTFTYPNADGSADVTWVYPADSGEVSSSKPIDVERFEYLWRVVTQHDVFARCPMRRSFYGADPISCHLISAYTQYGGQEEQDFYWIPVEETDPEFCLWLLELNGPWM